MKEKEKSGMICGNINENPSNWVNGSQIFLAAMLIMGLIVQAGMVKHPRDLNMGQSGIVARIAKPIFMDRNHPG